MKRKSELSRIWASTEARAEPNDTMSSDDDNADENRKFYCINNQMIEF